MLKQVIPHFLTQNNGNIDAERVELYRNLTWELVEVQPKELGIWDKAQGMPHEWCVGNLIETMEYYKKTQNHDGEYHKRIIYFLNKGEIDEIIVVDGATKRGRENCREMKYNIDDGCMRAIALMLKGYTRIRCYLGVRR